MILPCNRQVQTLLWILCKYSLGLRTPTKLPRWNASERSLTPWTPFLTLVNATSRLAHLLRMQDPRLGNLEECFGRTLPAKDDDARVSRFPQSTPSVSIVEDIYSKNAMLVRCNGGKNLTNSQRHPRQHLGEPINCTAVQRYA